MEERGRKRRKRMTKQLMRSKVDQGGEEEVEEENENRRGPFFSSFPV